MSIYFENNWNNANNYVSRLGKFYSNHASDRSMREVIRIIKEIAYIKDHPLSMAVQMGFDVTVLKGIHPDTNGKMHLSVSVNDEKYHIDLMKTDFRIEADGRETFVWRAVK